MSLYAMMHAAVYRGPGRTEVEERAVPAPLDGEVLVEVSHCGVCGTDLHLVMDGWGRPGSIGGHEYSGTVAGASSDVTGWDRGAHVVGLPPRGCGTCALCASGRPNLCADRATPGTVELQGAFARYVTVAASQLLAVPEGLSLREAALAEPLAVALHAVGRAEIGPDTAVLISGAGPIGALALAVLVGRGVTDVRVVEPSPARADLAARLGAAAVLSPDELTVPTIAEPGVVVDDAVDVVLECSGARAAMEAGLAQLAKGATMVIAGSGMEPPALDANRILLNELIVTGSFEYDAGGFEQALDLLASGALPTAELIHPVDFPLAGMIDAMAGVRSGEIAGKAMIAPSLDGDVPRIAAR